MLHIAAPSNPYKSIARGRLTHTREKDEPFRVCKLSIPIYVMEIDGKLFK